MKTSLPEVGKRYRRYWSYKSGTEVRWVVGFTADKQHVILSRTKDGNKTWQWPTLKFWSLHREEKDWESKQP